MNVYSQTKIPVDVVDLAVKHAMELKSGDAAMSIGEPITNHLERNTTVRFAPNDMWFNGVLYEIGLQANTIAEWKFQINHRETIQFAEYKTNQHYNWHMDTFLLSGQPSDRKITVVCMLSDPSEYVGGCLQLKDLNGEIVAPELKKGDVIVFPSFLLHRVTPVGAGTRNTAVMWLHGPAFK